MPQDTDATTLWTSCARQLRNQVSDTVWATIFNELVVLDLRDDVLRLGVPSPWHRERLEGRYFGLFDSALADSQAGHVSVKFEIHESAAPDDLEIVDDPNPTASAAENGPVDEPVTYDPNALADIDLTTLPATVSFGAGKVSPAAEPASQPFTFDDFVIGSTNRFAHAAAFAVAERPALAYNPLFIYGDAGLGKTHLLRAIASYVADHYKHYSVRYVSSEEFLNDFVEAIRLNTLPDFKRRYREVDLLLVDDIQFIEGKEGFQEEFFHTFNTLHQGQRQIVVSSDRPPDSIPTLEDRLRSRFKMGLITDIQPPDLETRLAILRQKGLTAEHRELNDDVLQFIASNITDNIRELEGALIRVTAYANLTGEDLTVGLAERVLADILSDRQPREITPDLILEMTSELFSLSIDEITGGSRRRPLVTARQVAMYVMREMTELSYPAIAREFGGRDHTTVIYAVDKIGNLMAERRQIFDQVTELTQKIKSSD